MARLAEDIALERVFVADHFQGLQTVQGVIDIAIVGQRNKFDVLLCHTCLFTLTQLYLEQIIYLVQYVYN